MRIYALDPYVRDLISRGNSISVSINGIEYPYCFLADEEKGYADIYKLDKKGNIFICPITKNRAASYRLYGKVEIVIKEKANE